jgi:hypothetical protein
MLADCAAAVRRSAAPSLRMEIAMITMKDCIDMCGLTEKEVMAIAEHEHVPEMAAAAMWHWFERKGYRFTVAP